DGCGAADAARQSEDVVRELRHDRLPLVHAGDDAQIGEALVRDLLGRQHSWDDTDHLATRCEDAVREDVHEPDAAAAVHEAHPARSERAAEVAGCGGVVRTAAETRPRKDADAPHAQPSMTRPPSTTRTWPVTCAAPSEAR